MQELVIARRYAKALFQASVKENVSRDIQAQCDQFVQILNHDQARVMTALRNPMLSSEERVEMVEKIAKTLNFHSFLSETIKLLLKRNKIVIFSHVAHFFKLDMNRNLGQTEAQISSAVNLEEAERARVLSVLEMSTRKKIIGSFSVDETLMGGICAQVDGVTFDASLRSRLAQAKKSLLGLEA